MNKISLLSNRELLHTYALAKNRRLDPLFILQLRDELVLRQVKLHITR